MPDKEYIRLSPAEQDQSHGRLFEMSIRFKCDARFSQIDDMLNMAGLGPERPMLKDAMTMRVTQVVPFIPDDEALAKYASALEDVEANGLRICNARFDGYDYLYMVRPAKPDAPKEGDGNG